MQTVTQYPVENQQLFSGLANYLTNSFKILRNNSMIFSGFYMKSNSHKKCNSFFDSSTEMSKVKETRQQNNLTFFYFLSDCRQHLLSSKFEWINIFSPEIVIKPHTKTAKHTQTIPRLLPANCLSVFDHFVVFSHDFRWNKSSNSFKFA